MLDLGWAELLVIAIVLVVVVGPKDLPRMLRTFGRTTTKLRRMAGDFRRQFDEALREAELDEVRDSVNQMRELDPRKKVRDAMNPMRAVGDEIRSSLKAATKAPEPDVPASSSSAKPAEPAKNSATNGSSAPEAAASDATIPSEPRRESDSREPTRAAEGSDR